MSLTRAKLASRRAYEAREERLSSVSLSVLGVMNGLLTARKILPLLDLLAKF